MTYPNGDCYIGQWHQGKADGLGKYTSPNGQVDGVEYKNAQVTYEGQWFADKQHGHGRELWEAFSEGRKFEYLGQFRDGTKDGDGSYRDPQGQFYGQWRSNAMDGHGVHIVAEVGEMRGIFSLGRMCGIGQSRWNDGQVYEGQYVNDPMHGFGTFVWSNGQHYKGYWSQGKVHDIGQVNLTDGTSLFWRGFSGRSRITDDDNPS